MIIMMGRFAITESMGRYSLPKQLDNIITWKVKIKETHIKYNTINKERNKTNTYIDKPSPIPSHHTPLTQMPLTLHLLLFLSIHWLESVEFECDHEQWELRFSFPLLLVQLSMRSTDASLHSGFDSQSFFSFYSTTLSSCSNSLIL